MNHYMLRIYTKPWAGNVDSAVQLLVFDVDDNRHKDEDVMDLYAKLQAVADYNGADPLENLLSEHPELEYSSYDTNMYYGVATSDRFTGITSYVEFYLNNFVPDTTDHIGLNQRLRWLIANDPDEVVGIKHYEIIGRKVKTTEEVVYVL